MSAATKDIGNKLGIEKENLDEIAPPDDFIHPFTIELMQVEKRAAVLFRLAAQKNNASEVASRLVLYAYDNGSARAVASAHGDAAAAAAIRSQAAKK